MDIRLSLDHWSNLGETGQGIPTHDGTFCFTKMITTCRKALGIVVYVDNMVLTAAIIWFQFSRVFLLLPSVVEKRLSCWHYFLRHPLILQLNCYITKRLHTGYMACWLRLEIPPGTTTCGWGPNLNAFLVENQTETKQLAQRVSSVISVSYGILWYHSF